VDLWELTARERIRDTLATYTWSGDSLRLDELAATFCEDGVLEIRGSEPLEGRAAIVGFLTGVGEREPAPSSDAKKLLRHNVTNVRFLEITPERARVVSYFTALTEIGLDHHGRYRDELVPVEDRWLFRHRFVSTDWRAETSVMVRD
jgi:hypothetical protein